MQVYTDGYFTKTQIIENIDSRMKEQMEICVEIIRQM